MLASISIVLWHILEKALGCSRSAGLGAPTSPCFPHDPFAPIHCKESFPNYIFFLSHSPQRGPKSHLSLEIWSRFLLEGGNPSLHQAVSRKFIFLAFDLLSVFAAETNGCLLPLHHRPNSRPRPEMMKTRAGFGAGARGRLTKAIPLRARQCEQGT